MRSSNREYVLASVLLVMAVFAVFYQVVGHGFINLDDNVYITENGYVQQGLTVRSLAWAFTSFHTGNWHPLTWLSHMLDFSLYGPKPWGHHLTNLLLHILNTVLLFLVFVRMTGSLWRSAFVAALFGIHPLHVESVAWASERKDVLSTLFWMLTMLAYVRYAEQPRLERYLPVVVLFSLGLMAKPMLVTLPFVLLLLDYWPLGRYREFKVQSSRFKVGGQVTNTQHLTPNTESTRAVVLEKVPLFILAAGSSVVTFFAQRQGGAVTSLERLSLAVRAANALVSYATYVLKMLWPAKLAVLYPHRQGTLPAWQVVGSAVLLALITVFVIRAGRPRPYLVVGWLWYVGTLVPVIGLVQVGAQAMADRYTYVPLIGLFTAIAWGLPDLVRKGEWKNGGMEERGKGRHRDKATPTLPHSHAPILTAFALMAILALMARAWVQVGYWKDSVTLLSRTIAITGDNYLAEYDLGNALVRKGQLDEAAGHYSNAVRINPNHAKAHNNLANILVGQGKVDEAAYHYSEALRLNPNDPEAHSNLGILLDHQGRTDEALAHLSEALSLAPGFAKGHYNLALILGKHGNITGAVEHLRAAIRIQPDYAEAHNNLGSALASQGQMEQAISHFREAIEARPDFAEAHLNLALALYLTGDYAGAWSEVRLSRKYGLEPRPDFLAALSRRMPEPSGVMSDE